MLGNAHFYNRTIRKVVVGFGTLFNDIQLIRYTRDMATEVERFKVPLSYGAKEKYLTRLASDPDLTKSIAISVPRISFDMVGMSYDSSRKGVTTNRNFSLGTNNSSLKSQYGPIPYNFDFNLSVYVRNTEDGAQIMEQILPFFTPDFTVTMDFIPGMDQKYDMPITLNSVNTTTEYEGGLNDGTTRLILWDLDFTVKSYLWPAVKTPNGLIGALNTTTGRYGSANTNIYIETQNLDAQKVTVNYATGNNYYLTGETIRVDRPDTDEITGKVVFFSNNSTGILVVEQLTQLLQANDIVVGDYTNASYNVTSVAVSPVKAIAIVTRPSPQNSDPDDEFGFSETITNWPNTLI